MITAASKVKSYPALVPTTAPTVTLENEERRGVTGASGKHVTDVSDDHLAVLQTISVTGTTVGVKPYEPKLEPKTVSVSVDDAAVLKGHELLTTGAAFRTRHPLTRPLPPP